MQQCQCEGVSVGHVKSTRRLIKGDNGRGPLCKSGIMVEGEVAFFFYIGIGNAFALFQYTYIMYIIILFTVYYAWCRYSVYSTRVTVHKVYVGRTIASGPFRIGTRVFLDITIFGQTLLYY